MRVKENRIKKLYWQLRAQHGRTKQEQWRLWCKRNKTTSEREEVIIGAVLTQNTNWRNVAKAITNLQTATACSLKVMARFGKNQHRLLQFQQLIKPAGFFRVKARYLINVANYFCQHGGVAVVQSRNFKHTRKQLLALSGVGAETADSILNYGLDKPVFVIDAYTKRLARRMNIAKNLDYDYLQNLFVSNIDRDWRVYQDFHALIVIDGKNYAKNKN